MKNYVCFKCPKSLCKHSHIKPDLSLRRCNTSGDKIEDYLTYTQYSNIISYEDKHCIMVAGNAVVPPCQCLSTNKASFKYNDKVYVSLLEIVLALEKMNLSLENYLQLIKIKAQLQ